MADESLKEKLITEMDSANGKAWYTVKELEELTGSTASQIVSVINSNDDFVRSSYLNKEDNLSRFSTRNQFDKSSSFLQKLKGAFKNTLD